MKTLVYAVSVSLVCLIGLVCPSTTLAGPVGETTPDSPFTVGDFLVKLASAIDPARRNYESVPQAVDFFTDRGLPLPGDLRLDSQLTERDVMSVTGLLGLDVASANPAEPFNADSARRYIGYLRDQVDVAESGRRHRRDRESDDRDEHEGEGEEEEEEEEEERPRRGPTGACCRGDMCSVEHVSECRRSGGTFRGRDIGCGIDTCREEAGTCCTGRRPEDCSITLPEQCSGQFKARNTCRRGTCRSFKDPESPIHPGGDD